MNPTKRNYLIIAGVVILLATVALGIVLNQRNAAQNPQLPAQVGQISDLSTGTTDTTSADSTITRDNTIDLSASNATTSVTGNDVTVSEVSNPTGNDTSTNDAIIVTTSSPASAPENPNPNLVAVAVPTNDSIPDSTDTPTTRDQLASSSSTECLDAAGQVIPCPGSGNGTDTIPTDEPTCNTATGENCPEPTCDPATGENCDGSVPGLNPDPNEPTCDPAVGGANCPEPECDPATGENCPAPECDPNDPTQDCGGNGLNCEGAGCNPEPECDPATGENCPAPECDPLTEDCGGNNFTCEGPGCNPEPECDPNIDPNCSNSFEPTCSGDNCDNQTTEPECDPNTENCNPTVEYTPPTTEETPVSEPVHPAAPTTSVKPAKLNDSGPANIALLLMSPAMAYLATKRKRK